ncbi:RELT-like protein 1 isoform X1 [Phyllobates terribilis]|uniref:RELT-like protein 1 isoform X1 n=1 Tax=Phyllobates terribilis TaxID=111132 RepID=UPI003CCAFA8A
MSPVMKPLGLWRVVRSADSQPSIDPIAARPSTSNAADSSSGGHPEYVAFYLVPIFFIMGLVGVLICHILKKKGYRCTTEAEPEVEKITGEKIEMQESVGDTNNDTVGQIVSFIMKNEGVSLSLTVGHPVDILLALEAEDSDLYLTPQSPRSAGRMYSYIHLSEGLLIILCYCHAANADVLKAMVADTSGVGDNSLFDPESPTTPNTPVSPTSPISPSSPDGTPSKHSCRGNHLHTIGGVAEKHVCSRCSNKRWNMIRSPLKQKESKKARQGAVTVLSVGRFRVTKVEPKSKERKRLMSDGTEATNGDVPSTPVSVDTRQRSGTETGNRSSVDT